MHLKRRSLRQTGARRGERGFTMLLALGVLTLTSVLLGGAYIAVLNDTGLSRNDLNQKRALAAAQAGIQAYNYNLNQNVNYWELCLPASNSTPVTVPGSTDAGVSETYLLKPLIAQTAPSGTTQCSTTNPIGTMIEGAGAGAAAGTFRIASTGTSGNVSRTIVAQYRSPSFLNYVYYTDYETLDPSATPGNPTDCAVHYPNRGSDCLSIQFVTGDSIKGPLHSEDTLLVCGSAVFGRTSADQIEAPAHSNEGNQGCTDSAQMVGTFNSSAPALLPPSTDAQILNVTTSAFHFTGVTTIVLSGAQMSVNGGAYVNDPSNGVVYVSTSATLGCSVTYTPFDPSYSGNAGCGNVSVSGNYSVPLTIASDNDIIINGNLTPTGITLGANPTGTAMLGLIANDFVRVYHPVSGTRGPSSGSCNDPNNNNSPNVTNATGSLTSPYIYAAILAVNHSFIVDNYDCGATLGTLHVFGVIAQLFRGPVGTSGNSGYLKDYNYDDRLATTEPPYFLNPVSAHWTVSRQTECDVAASC